MLWQKARAIDPALQKQHPSYCDLLRVYKVNFTFAFCFFRAAAICLEKSGGTTSSFAP